MRIIWSSNKNIDGTIKKLKAQVIPKRIGPAKRLQGNDKRVKTQTFMAIDHPLQVIDLNSPSYPVLLTKHLGKDAPVRLWAIGQLDLLNISKTAFFCSKSCPGDAILAAMDQAQRWRDEGRCIISGFHSPIEKECLRILRRGSQPVIICPARSLERMRIPKEWQEGVKAGQILLFSPFGYSQHRLTTPLSERRNKLVAALADEVYFAHITPGGKTARLAEQISGWGLPINN